MPCLDVVVPHLDSGFVHHIIHFLRECLKLVLCLYKFGIVLPESYIFCDIPLIVEVERYCADCTIVPFSVSFIEESGIHGHCLSWPIFDCPINDFRNFLYVIGMNVFGEFIESHFCLVILALNWVEEHRIVEPPYLLGSWIRLPEYHIGCFYGEVEFAKSLVQFRMAFCPHLISMQEQINENANANDNNT